MKTYLSILCLVAFAASAQSAEPPKLPPMFDPPSETGGLVMVFYIESVAPDENGNPVLTVAAADGEDRASFQLVIGKKWKPLVRIQGSGSGPSISEGRMVLKSVGPATEVFARAYARACKSKVRRYDFTEFEFAAVSVNSEPAKMMKEVFHVKLHQGALGSGEYFGIYCSIDIPGRALILQEREDRSSRKSLVRVFTGERPNKKEEKTEG